MLRSQRDDISSKVRESWSVKILISQNMYASPQSTPKKVSNNQTNLWDKTWNIFLATVGLIILFRDKEILAWHLEMPLFLENERWTDPLLTKKGRSPQEPHKVSKIEHVWPPQGCCSLSGGEDGRQGAWWAVNQCRWLSSHRPNLRKHSKLSGQRVWSSM